MDRREGLGREVGEKPVAFVFTNEIGELVVPAVDLVGTDETPFANVYPFIRLVNSFVSEGIAVNDILGKDVAGRLNAVVFAF